ncbi:MAG: DNA alkylation repair protein [Prevotella sp.]|nr:DNA alkylation repair protein [Bacteroidales bacterium]MDY4229623.1 DNA alkylation repair protein [Prevotella sp.]
MDEKINNQLKAIKQSFRLMMNGEASRSMREKGVEYKLNWGVTLPQLKQMATEWEKSYDLAIALWKEDIRECKILATLLMPAGQMPQEVAEIWMEQTRSQEMAEMLAFNLFQYLDYAPDLAYRWIANGQDLYQICGYNILSRLFMKGQEPNERGINEFIDQAQAALQGGSYGVRHAAMNCAMRFAEMNGQYGRIVTKALGI